ncbi:RNA-guided endonuclease IscB [Streptomyces himalayensis]|uniref:HNH endonuclease n=1 Tax=Streptomyces himalayensis subsp. himalayensis TaxID=2756131 RepID=A0A7W0DM59_9ACTN|nr:RNA-guided endonuclease IscB [Streptomyces himalayensis]MBA2947651.1 HNH endonuclease [Streptomyces himalayensis subsp. himalayensis]
MTSFDSREQTHPAVLPQRRALEPVAADNPGSRDETGHGLSAAAVRSGTGVEQGRGEMQRACTRPAARHTDLDSFGEAVLGREAHQLNRTVTINAGADSAEAQAVGPGAGCSRVFVLDRRGVPLTPCHPARARILLAKGRAAVVRHTPFVIRLKDRLVEESEVDGVEVRIDPGSKGTGIAVTDDLTTVDTVTGEVVTSRRGLFAVELRHRGAQIKAKLEQRSNYRRRRRVAHLRYRAPRFNNRTRPRGWLAPSLQHRVDTTMSWVERLRRWAPVAAVHVERSSFDSHALGLGKESLDGVEYLQGTLAGYEVRQYLLEKWGRACAYCGAQGAPLQVEHIQPKADGGSDRIANLTLACQPCNQAKAAKPIEIFLAERPSVLARIQRQAKTPLRDSAAMNATRWRLWSRLNKVGLHVSAWSGGRTKYNRHTQHLAKTHTLDALAVGDIPTGTRIVRHPDTVLVAKATGRGSYARTRTDKYGFPRLRLPRQKTFFGYQTGDLVRAVVPTGKKAGTHIGRVAIRKTGNFNISTAAGPVTDIHRRHIRRLQRADGYGYTMRKETA